MIYHKKNMTLHVNIIPQARYCKLSINQLCFSLLKEYDPKAVATVLQPVVPIPADQKSENLTTHLMLRGMLQDGHNTKKPVTAMEVKTK